MKNEVNELTSKAVDMIERMHKDSLLLMQVLIDISAIDNVSPVCERLVGEAFNCNHSSFEHIQIALHHILKLHYSNLEESKKS